MRATRCVLVVEGMRGASSPYLPRSLPPPGQPVENPRAAAMALVGDSVPPMDIDEFYEADPRLRASAELELCSEWLGAGAAAAAGAALGISWLSDVSP